MGDTQHIRYVTGKNSLCEEPVDEPQYYVYFDLESGPLCMKCYMVLQNMLKYYPNINSRSSDMAHPKTDIILSRKGAFKTAWHLFWMATGTSRVGINVMDDELEIVGSKLINE